MKRPNKALEPTPGLVTSRAGARLAPSPGVAHLWRWANREMKHLAAFMLWFVAAMAAVASEQHTVESLVGREFRIEDHWAGQELSFVRKERALVAVWRILGSGRPVLSEVEYPVEVKSSKQCVFILRREGKQYEVKIALSEADEIRVYLDGIRIFVEEKRPNKALEPTPTSVTPPAAQESRRP